MDRIQNAIAKARASRDGSITGHRAGKANLPQPSKAGVDWSTLTELRLSPTVLDDNRLVAHRSGPDSTVFDLMRINLVRQLQEHRWTRVAITSPGVGCGKTTVALNLAFSLARLTDIRVMVLELDFRRPTMLRAFGLNRRQNFAGVLAGIEQPEDQITRWGRNLAFGLNSAQVPNSAELLSSDLAADIVDVIEDSFRPDVMLFDMPPMNVGDDTLAFVDQVDCALMIAAAEETPISQIQQCGKELAAHTQVLGVVLNKCRMIASGENYGYDT
ncbi:MAG: chromosome partitioning protein [Rhodobacter sp.]|nr:chromosome partitioning protein [Rhodobacter sp.]